MTLHEEKIFHALYSCGAVTKNTIRKLGGDEDTIIGLIDKKLVKKEQIDIGSKSIAIYRFTRQGEKAYIDRFGKKHFYRCANLRKAAELAYFYASLTEEEKDSWRSKDELSQEMKCSLYPDSIFNKGGVDCGVFIVKAEDVDAKLDEYKQLAKEQKLKIILKRI